MVSSETDFFGFIYSTDMTNMSFYRLYGGNAGTQSRSWGLLPATRLRCREKERDRKAPPPRQRKTRFPPTLSSLSSICARRSSRSLFSHSEASLPASSSIFATGGPGVLPTSVARKSGIAARRLITMKWVMTRDPRVMGCEYRMQKEEGSRESLWLQTNSHGPAKRADNIMSALTCYHSIWSRSVDGCTFVGGQWGEEKPPSDRALRYPRGGGGVQGVCS